MISRELRLINSNERRKLFSKEVASYAAEVIEKDKSKRGILLCEGTESSVDVMVYSKIYSDFVVVPANGCTDIRKLMHFMRKYSEYATFGIIDRDNHSKKQIRNMEKEENVFCTKLPFIENIVCCPEVLKIITRECGVDYFKVLREVRNNLANILVEKMSLLNPFNIDLPEDKEVQFVAITIMTRSSVVNKKIDLSNIMYTFRDKSIVSEVATSMGFRSRDEYYKVLEELLNGDRKCEILFAMAKYLPNIYNKMTE